MTIITNLSDRWRVNKSQIKHIELTNTLKALRKVIGHLDLDIDVVWAGMQSTNVVDKIELPPSLVLGEYPIPGDKIDILVGFGIHESLHILENSRYIRDYHFRKHNDEEERNLVLQFVEICEDIHIDGVAKKKGMFGNYVEKYRTWWNRYNTTEIQKVFPSMEWVTESYLNIILDIIYPNTPIEHMKVLKQFEDDPNPDTRALAEALCAGDKTLIFGFHHIFVDILPECEDPLKILIANTNKIIENNARDRSLLYDDLWFEWGKLFLKWKREADKQMKKYSDDEDYKPITYSQAAFIPGEGLSSDLAEAVSSRLSEENRDHDSLLEASLESVGGENLKWALFPTKQKISDEICMTPPNVELAQKLKDIFILQKQEAMLTSRGLPSGKIDSKRLYRVSTTEMIFKEKEFDIQAAWSIAVLVDASSSMITSWELIESIFVTLAEAWKEHKNRLGLYSYAEHRGTCVITNLFHDNRVFTTHPSGNTPSGQAIISTAMLIPKDNKRLLIHITDGKINVGVDIDFAIEFCKNEGIDLLTIGTGMIDILELHERYGSKHFKVIRALEELPQVLEALLREKLLGRK